MTLIRAASRRFPAVVVGDGCQGLTLVSSFSKPGTSTGGLEYHDGALWHCDAATDTIYKLDPSDGSVLASFSSPGTNPHGLTMLGSSLWHADYAADTIYELDPSDGSVLSSFSSPDRPLGLTNDGTDLWAVCENNFNNTMFKLATSGTQLDSFSISWSDPSGVAYSSAELWACDFSTSTIRRVDLTGSELETVAAPSGSGFSAITLGGGSVWVVDFDTVYEFTCSGPLP